MFIHFATEWLRYLDCLQQTEEAPNAFMAQIDAFACHMRDERGLSPVTISTRCERLTWFFAGLCPPRDTLSAITVADIDAFLESKSKQGWTRASLAALASSLRSFFPSPKPAGGALRESLLSSNRRGSIPVKESRKALAGTTSSASLSPQAVIDPQIFATTPS
jgi:site-specific recombinase XerD